MKKKINKENILFAVLILLVILLAIFYYHRIFHMSIARNQFVKQAIQITQQNEKPIFKISKIMIYNGADVSDHSQGETLENINICQYTDIGVYIDNKISQDNLTEENTVSELIVEPIEISTASDKGKKLFNYKNPLYFGRFKSLKNYDQKINFDIIHTNRENLGADYNAPSFFTDCSNPVSLGYINKDIVTNGVLTGDNNTLFFNGTVLKASNIELKDIASTIHFKIRLKNNLGEEFVCDVNRNALSETQDVGIYDGYTIKTIHIPENQYHFLKTIHN